MPAERHCPTPTQKGTPCQGRVPEGHIYCATHDPDREPVERKPDVMGDWKTRFLEAFGSPMTVKAAMQVAGVTKATLYEARKNDEEFAAAWLEVEEDVTQRAEAELFRRGVTGVVKPVVSAGKYVTDVTEYSDTCLVQLLRARRPERYRERHEHNHSGQIDGKVAVVHVALDRGQDVAALLNNIGAAPRALPAGD
jgi:hypothetical protein